MRKSRLSPKTQSRLIELFVTGTTVRIAADLVGVNFKTAAYYFHRLRQIIEMATADETPFDGEIEIDESYFGGVRKGKRERGATSKIPVFGLLKRSSKVYAKVIPNTRSSTLMSVIQKRVVPDSIVYSDTYDSYNVLDVSEFRHYRINHSKRFANAKNHINGIENFWNQAKRHLRKFNGISRVQFPLYLEECEWRFNNPAIKAQNHLLKRWVKTYMG